MALESQNISSWRMPEFRGLQNADLDVARAWAIKETCVISGIIQVKHGLASLRDGISGLPIPGFDPVITAAKTIRNQFENIVTYVHHHITNALYKDSTAKSERSNASLAVFATGAYRTAIYFHCGGLDLFPAKSSQPQIIWKPG